MTTQVSGDTGVSQCQPGSVSQDDLQANVSATGSAFSAFNSVNMTAYVAGTTIVTDTEQFDTNGFHSNGVFSPTIPGYYFLSMFAYLRGSSGSPTFAAGALRRTGGSGVHVINGPSSAVFSTTDAYCVASGLFFMNGTTDSVSCHVQFAGSLVNPLINTGSTLQGHLVRAA